MRPIRTLVAAALAAAAALVAATLLLPADARGQVITQQWPTTQDGCRPWPFQCSWSSVPTTGGTYAWVARPDNYCIKTDEATKECACSTPLMFPADYGESSPGVPNAYYGICGNTPAKENCA